MFLTKFLFVVLSVIVIKSDNSFATPIPQDFLPTAISAPIVAPSPATSEPAPEADTGTVKVINNSSTNTKPNGALISKSLSKVVTKGDASGTASGSTSGTTDTASTAAGTAVAASSDDEGDKAMALSRTVSKVKKNGETITRIVTKTMTKGDADSAAAGSGATGTDVGSASGAVASSGSSTDGEKTKTMTKMVIRTAADGTSTVETVTKGV
nr:TSAG18-like protein [Limnephilus flavicornis]